MPKQEFGYEDLMGVLAVWCVFFTVIGVITVSCINFCCINEDDDVTVLEKWGHKKRLGVRLGIHKRSVIQRNVDKETFKADINLK